MKAKLLEIRDAATFIPVMAINLKPDNENQRYLLSRAGYGVIKQQQASYVIVVKMIGDITLASHDPYGWNGGLVRTMTVAHKFIVDHFDKLRDGDVIDVQFILGETDECKISEKYSN